MKPLDALGRAEMAADRAEARLEIEAAAERTRRGPGSGPRGPLLEIGIVAVRALLDIADVLDDRLGELADAHRGQP